MRIKELLTEVSTGKMSKRQNQSTRGVNAYYDAEKANSDYVSYRLGMAVASTDGTNAPNIDGKSWIGKKKAAFPYTQQEQDMLNLAYKAVGAKVINLNHGDMESSELDTTNCVSPVADWQKSTQNAKSK
jgi:hypothetical protein